MNRAYDGYDGKCDGCQTPHHITRFYLDVFVGDKMLVIEEEYDTYKPLHRHYNINIRQGFCLSCCKRYYCEKTKDGTTPRPCLWYDLREVTCEVPINVTIKFRAKYDYVRTYDVHYTVTMKMLEDALDRDDELDDAYIFDDLNKQRVWCLGLPDLVAARIFSFMPLWDDDTVFDDNDPTDDVYRLFL